MATPIDDPLLFAFREESREEKKHQNDGSFKYLWCARLGDVLVTFS